MSKNELKRLLSIPVLALMLSASEQQLAATIHCVPYGDDDCGILKYHGEFYGCTNIPYDEIWAPFHVEIHYDSHCEV